MLFFLLSSFFPNRNLCSTFIYSCRMCQLNLGLRCISAVFVHKWLKENFQSPDIFLLIQEKNPLGVIIVMQHLLEKITFIGIFIVTTNWSRIKCMNNFSLLFVSFYNNILLQIFLLKFLKNDFLEYLFIIYIAVCANKTWASRI